MTRMFVVMHADAPQTTEYILAEATEEKEAMKAARLLAKEFPIRVYRLVEHAFYAKGTYRERKD